MTVEIDEKQRDLLVEALEVLYSQYEHVLGCYPDDQDVEQWIEASATERTLIALLEKG